jgi:hypothetical protein
MQSFVLLHYERTSSIKYIFLSKIPSMYYISSYLTFGKVKGSTYAPITKTNYDAYHSAVSAGSVQGQG